MTEVAVKTPDGQIGTVDADEADQMPEGSALASPAEVQAFKARQRLEAEYGGLGGGLAAAGLGALRGASLGLSDPLIAGIGGEGARRALENYQEANPGSSLAGEVGGVVLPAFFTGGEGAIGTGAKVLSAPTRVVGTVGRGAEALAGGIVGTEARSVLGRVAQKALIKGAGLGGEAAIYGIGNEISDAAIHDHELTAEKLWAGAGRGALLGAGLGAAAGTVGQLAREGANSLAKVARSPSVSAWLEKQSLVSTGRAAGVNKRIATKAETFGDFDQMRRVWRDEAPGLVGKRSFSHMTSEDLAQAAESGLQRDGQKLQSLLEKADDSLIAKAPEKLPKAIDVIDDIERAADRIEGSKLGSGAVVNRMRGLAEDARRIYGLVDAEGQIVPQMAETRWGLQQMHAFRVDVDKAIGKFVPEMSGFKAELADVRRGLEKRLVSQMEEAGGQSLKDAYLASKGKLQAWYTLRDATKNAAAGGSSNRFFGLSEQLGGLVGGPIGGAVGGPIGHLIGAGVGSMAAHAVRTRGDFIAASLLNHVSQLGALERASGLVDNRIQAGIRGFLNRGTQVASIARRESEKVAAKDKREQARTVRIAQAVTHLATNDDARIQHVSASIGPLDAHAPSVATHAALKAQQSIFNLAQRAPKPFFSGRSLTPNAEKLHYSSMQVYQFGQYVAGYEDPLSLLDDMKAGYIDPNKLLGMQENHPRIYEQMHDELWNQLQEHDEELTWDQKKLASIFFGLPTDDALDRGFIRRIQQGAAQQADQPQDQQQGGGRRPMKPDTEQYQTASEQLATPM